MTERKREKSGRGRVPPGSGPSPAGGLVKLFYRIGEVAQIVGVAPHVLRYWESEFPTLKPQKSNHGQRVYTKRDVHKLLLIKHMLKEQGLTIAGARKQLRVQAAKLFADAAGSPGLADGSLTVQAKPEEVPTSAPAEPPSASQDVLSVATRAADMRQVSPLGASGPQHSGTPPSGPSAKSLRQALLSVRRELIDWLSDLQ